MKRIFTIAFLLMGTLFLAANANAQAVQRGNVNIDAYYGFPNFGKTLTKNISDNNETVGKVRGLGPLGVRAEYMLADKFGLGIDFIYNSLSSDITYDSLNNDQTLYRTYHGTASMQRIRVQLRFNYHFVSTEKLDVYTGIGAGTNTRIWKVKSTDPGYKFNSIATGTLLPMSMRLAVGMRYFFIPNLGVNAEIGIGGPLVSVGISAKF